MKKVVLFCVVLLLVSSLFVFGAGQKAPAKSGGPIKIGATFHSTYHEFFAEMIKGMKAEAAAQGVELIISDENMDVAKQNNTMANFIQMGVNAIILLSVDPEALNAAALDAMKAGIPVITVDSDVTDPKAFTTFIGSDSYQMGTMAGTAAGEYITKEMGGRATIGIVGWLSHPIAVQRANGFQDALKNVSGITWAGRQEADARDKALTVAETMLQGNRNINLLYGMNEGSTLGCLAAVEIQNKLNQVKVCGIDISEEVISAIEAGKIPFIVTQQPELMGRVGIQSAIKAMKGETLERRIVIPAFVVNKANVAKFK